MKYCESTEFPQCRQRNECKECRWSVVECRWSVWSVMSLGQCRWSVWSVISVGSVCGVYWV